MRNLALVSLLIFTSCATLNGSKGWNLHQAKGNTYKYLLCKEHKIESLADFNDYTSRGLPIKLINKCVIKVCKTKNTCSLHGRSKLKAELEGVSNPKLIKL